MRYEKLRSYLAAAMLLVALTGCHEESLQPAFNADCGGCEIPPGGGTVANGPSIQSFSPASGYAAFMNTGVAGTTVVINGSNFSTTPSNNVVRFNGVTATVSFSTATQITTSVPAGASTGRITVTTNNATATSATDFVVMASDSWQQLNDFAGTGKIGAISFVIRGAAYVGTGYNRLANGSLAFSKDFWSYNAQADTWTQRADFAGDARTFATGFAIGGKGYVTLGMGNSPQYFSDLWEYQPSTNTWIQKANFPGVSRAFAPGFSVGTKGYLGTGISLTALLNDFWQYEPATNQWTRRKDFAGTPRMQAGSFVINGRGYIGAGINDNVLQPDFWEYDALNNSWILKASLGSNAASQLGAFFSIGNKGYAGGQYNQMWMFDPVANTWQQKANIPTNVSSAVGFSIGSFGYIGLGNNPFGPANHRAFYKYTPD